MLKFVTNENHLKEEEMTEIVKRVKVLLVNSKQELLLGYSYHTYQFPGGHVEENETLLDAVKRELKEETGIEIQENNLDYFAYKYGYYKDYPSEGKNRKIEIYYYEIKTDEKPNLENTSYTEEEVKGDFELRYIPLNNVIAVLEKNAKEYGDSYGIADEMITLLTEYRREHL